MIENKYAFSILIFILIGVFVLWEPSDNKPYTVNKVRVDSISLKIRYELLPDYVYIYHTKSGDISVKHPTHSVGDSIDFKTLKLSE